jgi:long-chain fatty acid transport protein
MKIRTLAFLSSFALVALSPANILAGGFQRMDAASGYLGTAGAGQATDTTVSAAFNNPAGLAGVDSTDLYLGAIIGYDSFTFHDEGSEGVSPGFDYLRRDGVDYGIGWSGGPALYFAHPLTEKATIGFAMMSPFGGAADFGEDWVGSHFSEEASIFSVQASASLGYQLSDTWSVGAALGVQYLEWKLNVDLPPVPYGPVNPGTIPPGHPMYAQLLPPGSEEDIEIDDVQAYWSLGILWQANESTSLGLRYIPEINFKLKGGADILAPIPDMTVVQSFTASMEMATPSVTTLSLARRFGSRWTVLADIEHVGWDAWKENRVFHEGGETVVIERNWEDSMGYSLGLHFQASPKTLLKFGIGYDESPIASHKLKVDPPMDRQIGYSFGLDSQLTEKLRLVTAYQYLDMGDIRVEQTVFPGQVIRGYSDANCHVFHAALSYSF